MATKRKTTGAKAEESKGARSKNIAAITVLPSVNAAAVIEAYGKAAFGAQDINLLVSELRESMTKLNGGNLHCVENMLFGQAHALQSIFVNLARKASSQEYLKQYEIFLRLALKAQSQCRATLETLAATKNPPVVFAKQANIANGHQQINNGTAPPAHAKEIETEQSKLLEAQHGDYLDTPTAGATVGSNQDVETVGALDRPNIARG